MKAIESRLTTLEKAQRVAMPTVPMQVIYHSTDGTVREGPVFRVPRTGHPAERMREIKIVRSYGGSNGK